MITGEQIQRLLNQGYKVYSHALGRIGRVERAFDNWVLIKFNRGSGVTTFTSGDPVELHINEEAKTAKIVHPEWAF